MQGNAFHTLLGRNPLYAARLAALFGTRSAFRRCAIVATFLMQRPREGPPTPPPIPPSPLPPHTIAHFHPRTQTSG